VKDFLVKMPLELHTKLKMQSVLTGKTMLQFVVEAINEKLEREGK
jgi:predicted DNA-binding protein